MNNFLLFVVINYPNPFTQTTTILINQQISGPVLLEIFDVFGTKIRTIAKEIRQSGDYRIELNANDINETWLDVPGIYLLTLTTPFTMETCKMVRVK